MLHIKPSLLGKSKEKTEIFEKFRIYHINYWECNIKYHGQNSTAMRTLYNEHLRNTVGVKI